MEAYPGSSRLTLQLLYSLMGSLGGESPAGDLGITIPGATPVHHITLWKRADMQHTGFSPICLSHGDEATHEKKRASSTKPSADD
ncbi:unnamed protein product [Arctogadus glacialis]